MAFAIVTRSSRDDKNIVAEEITAHGEVLVKGCKRNSSSGGGLVIVSRLARKFSSRSQRADLFCERASRRASRDSFLIPIARDDANAEFRPGEWRSRFGHGLVRRIILASAYANFVPEVARGRTHTRSPVKRSRAPRLLLETRALATQVEFRLHG